MNSFIQQLDNDEIIWSTELYCSCDKFCPYPSYIYGRGNGLIMSKKIINIIKKYGKSYLYFNMSDDDIIGNILNTYWINKGKNYLDYIKSYKHAWFKCINENNKYETKYTKWNNTNKDWNFLNQFITIQIKRYNERHLENINYYEIHEVFENNKYNKKELNNSIKLNLEYSKNPLVFIGYIDRYPKYIDLNEYKNYDLIDLYNYQSDNKPFWDKSAKKILNII